MFPFRAFLFPSQETMTTWQSLGLKTALNNAAAIAHFLNQLWYVSGDIFLSRTQVEIKHWKTVTTCFLTSEEEDHLTTPWMPTDKLPPALPPPPAYSFVPHLSGWYDIHPENPEAQASNHSLLLPQPPLPSAWCPQDISSRLSAWPPTWLRPHPCFLTSFPQAWALPLCALSGITWSSISQK